MELGAGEIVVILVIVLLLFGPSKLPRLGEGLGRAMKNFKDAFHGGEAEPRPPGAEGRDRTAPPEPAARPPPEPGPPKGDGPA